MCPFAGSSVEGRNADNVCITSISDKLADLPADPGEEGGDDPGGDAAGAGEAGFGAADLVGSLVVAAQAVFGHGVDLTRQALRAGSDFRSLAGEGNDGVNAFSGIA